MIMKNLKIQMPKNKRVKTKIFNRIVKNRAIKVINQPKLYMVSRKKIKK